MDIKQQGVINFNMHEENNIMSKEFWRAALIRCARTIAQTAVATIGTTAVIQDVNWVVVGSSALLAGILSVLTSIATGLPEV